MHRDRHPGHDDPARALISIDAGRLLGQACFRIAQSADRGRWPRSSPRRAQLLVEREQRQLAQRGAGGGRRRRGAERGVPSGVRRILEEVDVGRGRRRRGEVRRRRQHGVDEVEQLGGKVEELVRGAAQAVADAVRGVQERGAAEGGAQKGGGLENIDGGIHVGQRWFWGTGS